MLKSRFAKGDLMDPLSLAAIGETALGEGIRFLYAQAGEVLKRRAERRRGEAPASAALALPSALFEGEPRRFEPDMEVVERVGAELRELRRALQDYGEGIELADPAREDVVLAADALRQLLEAIFAQ